MESILSEILLVLKSTLGIYLNILFIRVLLTWFPNLDWSNPILANLSAITDPYLNIFRGIIPPIGGLDLSPMLAFVAIYISQNLLGALVIIAINNSLTNYYG